MSLRPVERILIAGWLLFIAAARGGLLFARGKWVLAFGTEVLFSLFASLSSPRRRSGQDVGKALKE